MKIDVRLSIGYPTATQKDTLELDDDLTEAEIDCAVEEWTSNFIDWSWERSEND